MTKVIMKAAGGKTKLVPEILKRVPDFTGTYFERFLGGGSVFLALAGMLLSKVAAALSDANPELMNVYAVVQSDALALVEKLKVLKSNHSKEHYYEVRARDEVDPIAKAARTIYLNKTCFNGLYRVNAKGKFNVPIGSYTNPSIFEESDVLGWHVLLAGCEIRCEDFGISIGRATRGDFLYLDPPYLPRSKTANFTSYTSDKFALKDHERLASVLASASSRGASFLCSQGDSPQIRSLYKDFAISQVSVRHSVGAKTASRVNVDEVLIQNFA